MIAALLAALLAAADTGGGAAPRAAGWFFTGTVGTRAVQVELHSIDSAGERRLEGDYAYDAVGKTISLRGTMRDDGTFVLAESPAPEPPDWEQPPLTGRLRGRLLDTVATGTWSTPDDQRALPFRLVRRATFWTLADSVAANPDTLACPGPALGLSSEATWVRFDGAPWAALNDSLEADARAAVDRVRTAGTAECGQQGWSSTSVEHLSPTALSLGQAGGSFYQGAAHPNSGYIAANWSVEAGRPRRVLLSDLIADRSACRARLTGLLARRLRAKGASFVAELEKPEARTRQSLDARAVNVTRRGLAFTFSPYEVGSYAEGFYHETLTWQDLGDCIPADGLARRMMPKR